MRKKWRRPVQRKINSAGVGRFGIARVAVIEEIKGRYSCARTHELKKERA